MNTLSDYLELAKVINDIPTDYKLAKVMHVDKQYVSFWKHGKRTITVKDAINLGKLIGCDPIEILAVSSYGTETDDEEKEFWERIYDEKSTFKKIIIRNKNVTNNITGVNGNSGDVNIKIK